MQNIEAVQIGHCAGDFLGKLQHDGIVSVKQGVFATEPSPLDSI